VGIRLAGRTRVETSEPKLDKRPHEVAVSPDELAEGAPDLHVYLLPGGRAHELSETFLRWKPDLERVTGHPILITIVGDNEQGGDLYKQLRTERLRLADEEASATYRAKLKSQLGTPRAEIDVDASVALGIADMLQIPSERIPCLAWSTYPDLYPVLLLPVRKEWYQDKQTRDRFAEALYRWFKAGCYLRRVRPGMTVGHVRRVLKRLLADLSKRIDRAVGCVPKHRGTPRVSRIPAIILFEAMEETTLARPHPARLKVGKGGDSVRSSLTNNQLFYLTAFLFRGSRQRIDKINWTLVDERALASRLIAWRKVGLRKGGGELPERPEHRIMKEWPRFVKVMNDRAGKDGWFDEKIYSDRDSRRCYRQRNDHVSLGIRPNDGEWLRGVIKKLTGQL
jgi:hypothetical protein